MTAIRTVHEDELRKRLDALSGMTLNPVAGVFGPDSMTWQVNRHAALFWGSWRALMLQLAHPWVANAVSQHSSFSHDPLGRFHRTFRIVFKLTFADLDTAIQTALGLHAMHEGITGTVECPAGRFAAGSHYQANEAHALLWVHATLIDTSLLMFEHTVRPLSDDERARYYEESKRSTFLYGIPEDLVPPDWPAFCDYWNRICNSDTLQVCSSARAIARQLFRLRRLPSTWLMAGTARAVTRVHLPDPIRKGYGLAAPDAGTQARARRALQWTARIFRHLPPHLRFAAPYLEATQRVAGRPCPRVRTRMMNRLWIGQPQLVPPHQPSDTSTSDLPPQQGDTP